MVVIIAQSRSFLLKIVSASVKKNRKYWSQTVVNVINFTMYGNYMVRKYESFEFKAIVFLETFSFNPLMNNVQNCQIHFKTLSAIAATLLKCA